MFSNYLYNEAHAASETLHTFSPLYIWNHLSEKKDPQTFYSVGEGDDSLPKPGLIQLISQQDQFIHIRASAYLHSTCKSGRTIRENGLNNIYLKVVCNEKEGGKEVVSIDRYWSGTVALGIFFSGFSCRLLICIFLFPSSPRKKLGSFNKSRILPKKCGGYFHVVINIVPKKKFLS